MASINSENVWSDRRRMVTRQPRGWIVFLAVWFGFRVRVCSIDSPDATLFEAPVIECTYASRRWVV